MDKYVFFSCTIADKEKLNSLILRLERDFCIWHEECSKPTPECDAEIARRIREATCFLFVDTAEYRNSYFCQNQIRYASMHDVPVFMISPDTGMDIESVSSSDEFYEDLCNDSQVLLNSLMESCKKAHEEMQIKKYVYNDGRVYEGEMSGGLPNGKGRIAGTDGSVYEGDVKKGLRCGHGCFTWPDGRKYVGEYKDDLRCGNGTMTYADGGEYIGSWLNDYKEGHGKETMSDGRACEGEYSGGELNGTAIYSWPNGDRFEGTFEDGKKKAGLTRYANGDTYDGEYKNEKSSGRGVYVWTTGYRYEGEYSDGEKNGYGKYLHPDGSVEEGYWVNGKLQS